MRKTMREQPVWIDLGCGDAKQPGFIGIDRFALPGVDVVCDLDRGIPLPSNSVEYLLASHSLEHLRDLPSTIAEIFRVCKDRALITIIAPYDATRLNRANPYHFQAWNEHTARFFTTESASTIDPAEYRFPAAEYWGLQGSDFTRSDIDLRCLRMEFSYLPPYRSLDEETKRTLRHSLSDVCDQMALHLLVVKSPIAPKELSDRAATIQYPVPPAFEARRRAEADVDSQNLFSELARTPARVTALSTKANEEIALLGDEMRRFLQRIDHIDRALVSETQEGQRLTQRVDHLDRTVVTETSEIRRALSELVSAGRTLSERMTAINSAVTRNIQKNIDEVRAGVAEKLNAVTELQSTQAKLDNQILLHLVAERRARADYAYWPIRSLRRYRQRAVDLRSGASGEFSRLWQGPEAPQSAVFKLQRGSFLQANVVRVYRVVPASSPLREIEIGVSAIFPPGEPVTIADFELLDTGNNTLYRVGSVSVDHSCDRVPVTITFEPLHCEPGQPLTLKLFPRASVERIGVQLFEWHRITRLLRRVQDLRLAYRARF